MGVVTFQLGAGKISFTCWNRNVHFSDHVQSTTRSRTDAHKYMQVMFSWLWGYTRTESDRNVVGNALPAPRFAWHCVIQMRNAVWGEALLPAGTEHKIICNTAERICVLIVESVFLVPHPHSNRHVAPPGRRDGWFMCFSSDLPTLLHWLHRITLN